MVAAIQLHYESAGEGKCVLCIPGALGTGLQDFGPQLRGLSDSYCIIAPDPRGYGKSRPPTRDFPLDYLQRDAEDMTALMTELGHERFAVAGWSDGAIAATLLAISYPERVSHLIIWGGHAFIGAEDVEIYESTRDVSSWPQSTRSYFHKIYDDQLQKLWNELCDCMLKIQQRGGELCRERLYLIRAPTLILHGGKDPLIRLIHPYVFQKGIKNARLHVFPEGRHHIQLQFASEFNDEVKAFLDQFPH